MMVIKLVGFTNSPYTRQVATVLHEKKVPFKFIPVKDGEIKSAEYLKKNPFGKAPYLVSNNYFTVLPPPRQFVG